MAWRDIRIFLEASGRARLLFALAFLAGVSGGFATSAWAQPGGLRSTPRTVRLQEVQLRYAGRDRKYYLHVPRNYGPADERPALVEPLKGGGGAEVPLLIALHGEDSSARELARVSRFQPLSAQDGFILVYPEADGHGWNDKADSGKGRGDPADDVGFLASLVAELSEKYRVDQRRIYLVGSSQGALMAMRAVCELPGLFAAVATVNGSLPVAIAEGCSSLRPISVAMVNGTADGIVPFDDRVRHKVRRELGDLIPAEGAARFFARLNGCVDRPHVYRERNVDIATGDRVHRAVYGDCRSNKQVHLFIIDNGGHRWPEPNAGALTRLLGGKMGAANAFQPDISQFLWEFLARQQQ